MDYRFASSIEQLQSSAVRDILKLTQGKDMVSFAGGLPAEELFPLEAIRHAADRVFSNGYGSLQYGLTEGYMPLREQISARMSRKGMNIDPEQIILTTGSQQAIDLIARVLLEPDDVVLVETPTYLASLQVFRLSGARIIPVASDKDGMIMEDLRQLMKQHQPRLVYAVPTFGNPTGRVWSIERRLGLVELCRQYGVVILEDDPYGDIKFNETAHYPTLFSIENQTAGGCVIYTSTFSKTVAPALRTGWAMGDRIVIQMMAKAKQAADLHSSTVDQQILSQLLEHFALDAHILSVAQAYSNRMQRMQVLLQQQNLRHVNWVEPLGGMFLWLQLPEGLDAEALLRCAVMKNVAFVPGAAFYVKNPQRNTARFNFTHTSGERMALGIKGLGEAIREFTARS